MKLKVIFSNKRFVALAAAAVVAGMSFMLVIDAKADVHSEDETTTYTSPSAGMSTILADYTESSGESSLELLSTTAVGSGLSGSQYYAENGGITGRLIVCTAEDYSPVYLVKDTTSGVYGRIYTYGTATLIEEEDDGWYKIVSGVVSGYVRAEDFATGEDAEALDELTYKTVALIDTDELTLREEKSMTSVALCILASLSEHTVVEEDDGSGWTKLYVEDVGEGYVLTEYLSISTVQMKAVTVDEEYLTSQTIDEGVEEALEREAQWTADRIAAEEAAAAAEAAAAQAAAEAAAEQAAAEEAAAAEEETAAASSDSSESTWSDSSSESTSTSSSSYEEETTSASTDSSSASTDSSDVASIRQALVDYACSFAGWLPYVSGGSSLTTGADCSGFTSAIYAAFGYSIPRRSS